MSTRCWVLVCACAALFGAVGCDLEGDRQARRAAAGGQFELTWALEVDGEAVRCTDVGAAAIAIRADLIGVWATNRTTGEMYADHFSCAAFGGLTRGMPLADYRVQVAALRNAEIVASAQPVSATIDREGQIVYLGEFTFALANR